MIFKLLTLRGGLHVLYTFRMPRSIYQKTTAFTIKPQTSSRVLQFRSSTMATKAETSSSNAGITEPMAVNDDELIHQPSVPSIASGHIKLSTPIGYIRSCFKSKNGTPRQPTVCSYSRAKLRILKSVFVCPDHSLDGLAEFSHVWILFVFHQNSQESFSKAKVKPPRLDGKKVGVFASRTPHRPNPIGLTLARLDKVEGDCLYLSGMDMIDGTPVLDIKPYVPQYDSPKPAVPDVTALSDGNKAIASKKHETSRQSDSSSSNNMSSGEKKENIGGTDSVEGEVIIHNSKLEPEPSEQTVLSGMDECPEKEGTHNLQRDNASGPAEFASNDSMVASERTNGQEEILDCEVRVAGWVNAPPIKQLCVRFTTSAEEQLTDFWREENRDNNDYKMEFLKDALEARRAIEDILSADPRSVYRRKGCADRLYFFTVDNLHITSWFGSGFAEVLNVQPVSQADIPLKTDSSSPNKKVKL